MSLPDKQPRRFTRRDFVKMGLGGLGLIAAGPIVSACASKLESPGTVIAGTAATPEAIATGTSTPRPSATPTETQAPSPSPTATATETQVPPTPTGTATEVPASPTTAPTTAPTVAPTVAPTRLVAPETISLQRYAVYVGDLINAGNKAREGGIIMSYLPDLPDQQNKILVYSFFERSEVVSLFTPQKVEKKPSFEEIIAKDWSVKEGYPEGIIGNVQLITQYSSPRLFGRLIFPARPDALTFTGVSKGSGEKVFLDLAVELYKERLGLKGPGIVMNPTGMKLAIENRGIRFP